MTQIHNEVPGLAKACDRIVREEKIRLLQDLLAQLPEEKKVPEYKKRREFDSVLGFNDALRTTKSIIESALTENKK